MSDWPFSFRVHGTPVPKGSNFIVVRGKIVPKGGNKEKKWESIIRSKWMGMDPPDELDVPVEVYLRFYMRRPKRPRFTSPAVKPDIDKLARCAIDGMQRYRGQRGLFFDDSRIVSLGVDLEYASEDEPEGVMVVVNPFEE